jgi:hypothetical protein
MLAWDPFHPDFLPIDSLGIMLRGVPKRTMLNPFRIKPLAAKERRERKSLFGVVPDLFCVPCVLFRFQSPVAKPRYPKLIDETGDNALVEKREELRKITGLRG